jgi:hypothetical protein
VRGSHGRHKENATVILESGDTAAKLPALYTALAKAQRAMKGALKDSENPFFKSRYADLASVREACIDALTDNELCVIQMPETSFSGTPEVYTFKSKTGEDRSGVRVATTVSVRTRLGHSSGEWVEDVVSALLPSGDPQAVGSAITYLRRYALAAMVGVAPEDDDGEATTRPVPPSTHAAAPHGVDRDTGEVLAVTLDSVVPFGKHKGKTVKAAGHGYFEYLSDQPDFSEGKGKAWHTFTVAVLAAYEDAESEVDHAAKPPVTDTMPDLDLPDPLEPEKPKDKAAAEPDAALATPEQVKALRTLLEQPEVPEKTFKLYVKMLEGLGDKVTVADVRRMGASASKAARAALAAV